MRPLKVLIVEDHLETAEMICRWTEMAGHQARVCYTGFQALQAAPSFQPEVVLLDLGLPDMDGWDLARSFRKDFLLSRAKIIAISAFQTNDDKRRSLEAGIDYHVGKPVQRIEIVSLLAQAGS